MKQLKITVAKRIGELITPTPSFLPYDGIGEAELIKISDLQFQLRLKTTDGEVHYYLIKVSESL